MRALILLAAHSAWAACSGSFTGTPCKATVGTGQTYTTLQACHDAIPSNLVTDGNSYVCAVVGEVVCATGSTPCLQIGDHTTDSTHYMTIAGDTGQSFPTTRTNALKYDATKGAAIRKTDNYGSVIRFTGTTSANYTRITALQMSRSSGSTFLDGTASPGPTNLLLQDLLLDSNGAGAGSTLLNMGNVTVANVLIIVRTANDVTPFRLGASSTVIGCGAIRPITYTATGTAFARGAGTPILISSYSFGFSTASSTFWDTTNSKHNATDVGSIVGSSAQVSVPYSATAPFTSAADASLDLRVVTGDTTIGGKGFRHSSASNDISGYGRSTTPTVGPWELDWVPSAIRKRVTVIP